MAGRKLEVLTVVHMGNYDDTGKIIDDSCPCCGWEAPGSGLLEGNEKETLHIEEPEWHLGMIWAPGAERGIGAYFQVFHCQNCGLVYATHVN